MITLKEDDFFEEALTARRSKLRYRLLIAAIIGLGFSALGNWAWLVGWYVTYALVNLADDAMLRWRAALPEAQRRRIVLRPCLGTGLSNLVFVALALPAPGTHGPWGVLALGFLVGGITLYSIMAARASLRSFVSVMAPLGLGFLSLPILAYVEGGGFVGVAVTAVGATLTISAVISHWRDSSQVRRAEQAARFRAEAAEAAKTQILAMVSHDLRTPLTAIRAGADQLATLGRERDLGLVMDHARLIQDAGTMMRTLLDDLLDTFKTEAGRLKIVPVPMEPRRHLQDLIQLWSATATEKGLSFGGQVSDDLPTWIQGDPTRLHQIANNLVSNAVKFTTVGGVTIQVRVKDGLIVATFTDTGPGLTKDEIAGLFQPYAQTSVGQAHGGGTGLGLSISRDLARAMGGDLVATSRKGEGACFTLTFPLVAADAPPVEVLATKDGMAGLRVLIVDDHPMNRTAMRLILGDVADTIDEAESGAAALSHLSDTPVDLILMDVYMPDMDGWETTRRLRRDQGPNRDTPVIAVTGATTEAAIQSCMEAGMTCCVAKPIVPGDLFAAIEDVMSPVFESAADQGRAA